MYFEVKLLLVTGIANFYALKSSQYLFNYL